MKLPGAADYMEALQDPASCLSDPELAAGSPVLTALGLPKAVSGNVATVFRLQGAGGRSWAVRCFVRPLDEERLRYGAIREHLRGLDATWPVGFDFQPLGIRVGGEWWPVLKMDWAPGEPLLSYVERHLWDGAGLRYLAARFLGLAASLRDAGVAHGDLQHGNILVAPGGDLRLVDYDGMYVPALAGRSGTERGHRNYQHPGREVQDFGPGLDAFSAWVLYASLAALADDPLLWGRFDGGEEALLLRHHDLTAPERSAALAALDASTGPGVAELSGLLRSFLATEPEAVPPLTEALAPPLVLPTGRAATSAMAAGAAAMREAWSRRPGTPPVALTAALASPADDGAHMVGARETDLDDDCKRSLFEALTSASPAGADPWRTAEVEFSGDLRLPRRILAGGMVGSLVLLLLLAFTAGSAVAVAGFLAGTTVTMTRLQGLFRQTPEAQGALEAGAVLAEPRRAFDGASTTVDRLERARAGVAASESAAATRAEFERTSLRSREEAELRVVDAELEEVLSGLAARERAIAKAEQQARSAALTSLQQSVIESQLGQHSLVTASAWGVSETVVHRLSLDGVRTAADFTGVEVSRTGGVVVCADGRRLTVGAVDQRQATAMLDWKRRVATAAQLKVPDALPRERQAAIRAEHDARRAALAKEADAARAEARSRADAIRARWQSQLDRVDDSQKQAEAGAAAQRVELDRALVLARKDVVEAEWHLSRSADPSAPPPDLDLTDFLRHLIAVGPLAGLARRTAGAHASRGRPGRRPPLEL